jgi:uncharacterized protein (DUF885 family)
MSDELTTSAASEAARALADRYWDDMLELEPILATQIGDDRFDDRLPDTTEDGIAHAREVNERARREAAAIDRSSLEETERTTLDVLDAIVDRSLEAIRMRTDRLAGPNHILGPGALLVQLGSLQRGDTPERVDRYVARLGGFPAFLEGMQDGATAAADEGVTQPRLVVDRTIGQIQRLVEIPPDESPALAPVAESEEARGRVVEVLRDVVYPAYGRFLDALRAYSERARDSIGLADLIGAVDDVDSACAHPTGDLVYQFTLAATSDVDIYGASVDGDGRQRALMLVPISN